MAESMELGWIQDGYTGGGALRQYKSRSLRATTSSRRGYALQGLNTLLDAELFMILLGFTKLGKQ